jgi:hypothetical protein
MQKLDFVKNIEIIVEKLKTNEIVNAFNSGFSQPGTNYSYQQITPLLFLSKSNFDQLYTDPKFIEILDELNAPEVYSEKNLSHLTTILRSTTAQNIIAASNAIALFNFHNTILSTYKLTKAVLLNETISNNFENNLENGVVIFQIVIDEEGLETEKYIKILSALEELTEILNKIYGEETEKSEIILLDSGSDTNLGIKTGIETAKSLFLIFKEIWDFATNFKHYKAAQKNKTLLDSLSIRAEIKLKVEQGVLTKDEGLEYSHIVKTRTDDLIALKVLPKQILMEQNFVENKKLLKEFEGMKLLGEGE